jgi:UDP-N-acetylmuramoyl-tripeptide--D-alanyl-D-alanine ligase
MKTLGKNILCRMLSAQVIRLRAKHKIKVVAVAGSVGKTSTKLAIARLLGSTRRVLFQEGNYNDPVTVPLVFFGRNEPGIFNIFAWGKILLANELTIRRKYPYQFVVIELGTDAPGTMKRFAYLRPDLTVLTAVTEEHMEYFGSLDGVAKEELAVFNYTRQVLVNVDDTPPKYLAEKKYKYYGLDVTGGYHARNLKSRSWHGQRAAFYIAKKMLVEADFALTGSHGAKITLAAVAAADILGLGKDEIESGVSKIVAFAGRMQILPGIKNSTLIDDTYNSSPAAVRAALDVLYAGDAPQRIAILGSMNEMGDYSKQAHQEVGAYCNPKKLDWVVTIGPDAKKYLAPAAKEQGCEVKSFLSPYDAGHCVAQNLKEGAVVLAKGSQNRVFAEEALKELLSDPEDVTKLVRQSAYWQGVKSKQFIS